MSKYIIIKNLNQLIKQEEIFNIDDVIANNNSLI